MTVSRCMCQCCMKDRPLLFNYVHLSEAEARGFDKAAKGILKHEYGSDYLMDCEQAHDWLILHRESILEGKK